MTTEAPWTASFAFSASRAYTILAKVSSIYNKEAYIAFNGSKPLMLPNFRWNLSRTTRKAPSLYEGVYEELLEHADPEVT
jgi:hypothetical protein